MYNPDAQQSHNFEFVSGLATDEQMHHLTTEATHLRLELAKSRRNGTRFRDSWLRLSEELNSMPAVTQVPRRQKYWQITYNKLVFSVQQRLHRLRICEQDSSITATDREAIVEALNSSWKPWERWLIDRIPELNACGAINSVRTGASLWRLCDEQITVMLMFMHRWPELRPKPSCDELDDDADQEESMDTDSAAGVSQQWLQLISVLNTLGAKHSPAEWQKYVNYTRDDLLAKIDAEPDADANARAVWPPLLRGLAQLLWPDRFGAFTPVVNPEPGRRSTYRRYDGSVPNRNQTSPCTWSSKFSRPDRSVQIQIDLIASHLKQHPAMWHAVVEPTAAAGHAPTTPAWQLLVDILNTVGSRCTSDAWHKFVCKAVHAARTARRYEMTWFELQLSELWNGGAVLAQAAASVDQLVCADVCRTDGGQLWYFCRLCNGEFEGETPFGRHCRDAHGLDVDVAPGDEHVLTPAPSAAEAAPMETATVDECKHRVATMPETDAFAEPSDCKRESADELRPPEQPLFVDVLAHEPMYIKREVMEDDDTAAIVVKTEPAFVDESMAELEADGGHAEFTWRYIDAEQTAKAEQAEETPPTQLTPTGKMRKPKSAKAQATEAAKAAAKAARLSAKAEKAAMKQTNFICDLCQKKYHVKRCLARHMKEHIHSLKLKGSTAIDDRVASDRLPHVRCAECDQTFATRKARDAHINAEHTLPLDPALANAFTLIESANAPGAAPSNGFECPECRVNFERQSHLRTHYMQEHGIVSMIRFDEQHGRLIDVSTKRPILGAHYRCNLCPFTRVKRGDMNKHMRTHSEVPTFLCSRCPFRAKTRTKLSHHRKVTHSDQLPTYPCEWCDFRATENFVLERHRRLHTGELPYVCTAAGCGRAFRLMKSLRNHFTHRHYEGPPAFKCQLCPEMFANQCKRTQHVRLQHPEVPLRIKFRPRRATEFVAATAAAKATAATDAVASDTMATTAAVATDTMAATAAVATGTTDAEF